MKLKQYQTDTLSLLRRFFEEARTAGPKNVYEAITKEQELAGRLGRYAGAYNPLAGLPNVPYVCLRLPTGGGKTILGACAIRTARDAWIEKDYPLVLWLVPTNTIRRQTAEALKNSRHAYRKVLDVAFDGRIRVFDIADFTHIRPHDLRDRCCIVVGTIQTLRVKSTEGRKVYAHNEDMEPHFSTLPANAPGLEKLENGGVKFSFANLLHIHRPLMIVDEAHNAVTRLTREMQARVNPCAIVEFTATPRLRSNILYSVTAQELKAEEMVKLPIMLSEHDTWQNPEALVLWLDRQVRQIDIHPSILLKWLRDLVDYLIKVRRISTSALMRCKFILARKIQDKIDGIRRKERHSVYQRYLFEPGAKAAVSFDNAFSFKEGMFGNQRRYRGRWRPQKHFLGADHVPAFDGTADGEEFQCAQALDFLPGLRYWVRNVARHPDSFWLPTASDKFYPDFVALLDDGRLLVVEYKGAYGADSSDTAEKRTVGELWERKSDGKGLFLVAENMLDGRDVRQQLIDKVNLA